MDNPKVKVRTTKRYGRGVFASQKIKKGEEIAAFDGPIYDDDFPAWTKDIINHAIQIGPTVWRDSCGIARLINHSCNPNCGIKKRTHIVAMRPIEKGEEITWDYEMTEMNDWWRMKCQCGAPSCRKNIGDHKNMPEEVRRKYKGFISEWILDFERSQQKRKRR
jgi:uncharacterized protein